MTTMICSSDVLVDNVERRACSRDAQQTGHLCGLAPSAVFPTTVCSSQHAVEQLFPKGESSNSDV